MELGLSMGTAGAGMGDGGMAVTSRPTRTASPRWKDRYSPRTSLMIWAAASVVAWAIFVGVGAGAVALGRLAFG